jgi:hypothetical protein
MTIRAIRSATNDLSAAFEEVIKITGIGSDVMRAEYIELRQRELDEHRQLDCHEEFRQYVTDLTPWIGRELIGSAFWTDSHRFKVRVDPSTGSIVHWWRYGIAPEPTDGDER